MNDTKNGSALKISSEIHTLLQNVTRNTTIIDSASAGIQKASESITSVTDSTGEQQVRDEVCGFLRQGNQAVNECKTDLEKLSGLIETYMSLSDPSRNPQQQDILRNQLNTAKFNVTTSLNLYNRSNNEFNAINEAKFTRRLATLTPGATVDELEYASKNAESIPRLLERHTHRKPDQLLVQSLQNTAHTIGTLEQNASHLAQIVQHVSALIVAQQEQVEAIADHAYGAHEYVQKGEEEVILSRKKRRRARKRKIWVGLFLTVLIITISSLLLELDQAVVNLMRCWDALCFAIENQDVSPEEEYRKMASNISNHIAPLVDLDNETIDMVLEEFPDTLASWVEQQYNLDLEDNSEIQISNIIKKLLIELCTLGHAGPFCSQVCSWKPATIDPSQINEEVEYIEEKEPIDEKETSEFELI